MLEVLGALLGLGLVLGFPALLIWLVVSQGRLRRRVIALEAAVQGLMRTRPDRPATPDAPVEIVRDTPTPPPAPSAVPVLPPGPTAPADAAPATPPGEAVVRGPWRATPEPADIAPSPAADRPVVFRADRLTALLDWLRGNWFYAVSAASLALAGIFLVQYGIERGLIPPGLRVLAALAFGAVLIGAGEWIRRRWGDSPDSSTAYLPSVLSGAGVVTLFAAVLAARQLYGLVGPAPALAGLVAVSALAIGLGWRYGPLMAALGLLGAGASPFIVAGGGTAGSWLYGYFAVVAATGLGVDAVRRWAWISVLALAIGYGGGAMASLAGAGVAGHVAFLLALTGLALVLPPLSLVPQHPGPALFDAVNGRGWPEFPVRLALGALTISTLGIAIRLGGSPEEAMMAFAALGLLVLALLLWAERAPGLADSPGLPALAWLVGLGAVGMLRLPLASTYLSQAIALRPPETAAPMTASLLLAGSVVIGAAFALRALRPGPDAPGWAKLGHGFGAVAMAPLAALALHGFWQPDLVLGTGASALQVMIVAALSVALALAFARADGADRRRAAWAVLAALAMIALSLVLVLIDTALTLSLAALVAVAAALDRRFRLPEMGVAIMAGLALVGWRFWGPVSQGWLIDGALAEVLLTFLGVLAAIAVALWQIAPLDRRVPRAALEASGLVLSGLLVNVLVERWLNAAWGDVAFTSHWRFTLAALPWIAISLGLLHRAGAGGWLSMFHRALAGLLGAWAALLLGVGVTFGNPLWGFVGSEMERVLGWPVFSSLLVGYGLPGLVLVGAAWRMASLSRPARVGLGLCGAGLLALWAGTEIRHIWQGSGISLGRPTGQGELYSYSLALILVGAGLLYQSVAARSSGLRRVATGVIALAIAKVFLVDASGLSGLTRVASFLGLGLALAGLAWLNRWAGRQSEG